MQATQAVGIDLGTTYSCIAALDEHGKPFSILNPEGETSTPSVVFFDHDEIVVGFEALRNAVARPDLVVQNAKRYMGDLRKRWNINGKSYSPSDIGAIILRQLLVNAEKQLQTKITQAVITVPAQFSDAQRASTAEAGRKAGLERIDIINEPVAAALCYVLGADDAASADGGMWFNELANEQTILVYDLGGGTFDLSLVKYKQDEVRVLASTGDLHLGGIDFNEALLNEVADKFEQEFKEDPRDDPQSLQYLAIEVEQAKRSLTARPRTPINIQHAGKRKTYQVERERFNELTAKLVKQSEDITLDLLKSQKMGWAKVDVVLMTGGSSRMQCVAEMLKRLSGRTLNTSLSPDQSIAHGASYYAGMLLSKSDQPEFVKSILTSDAAARFKKVQQKSVTARGLGILIRDSTTNKRVPYYLIDANTTLPASKTHIFGTVVKDQRRVHLQIVESGARADLPFLQLAECVIEDLPRDLPPDSEIAVTISYDERARVLVSAKEVKSGKEATAELIRSENLIAKEIEDDVDARPEPSSKLENETLKPAAVKPEPVKPVPVKPVPVKPATASPILDLEETTLTSKPDIPVRKPPSNGTQPVVPKPIATPVPNVVPPSAKPKPMIPTNKPTITPAATARVLDLEDADVPVALCGKCGEPLNARGVCPECGATSAPKKPAVPVVGKPVPKAGGQNSSAPAANSSHSIKTPAKPVSAQSIPTSRPASAPVRPAGSKMNVPIPLDNDDDIIDLFGSNSAHNLIPPLKAPPAKPAPRPAQPSGQIKPAIKPAPQPKSWDAPIIPLDD
jgi:molecular chaperone DnaK